MHGGAKLPDDVNRIITAFEVNVAHVYQLMDFDHLIQDEALRILKKAQGSCEHLPYSARMPLQNGIASLETLRSNDSLRRHYEHMLNQCVVLLVSYFGSAARDVFRLALTRALESGGTGKLLRAEFKMTVGELTAFVRDDLPETFITKSEISFQDMQSIGRAFREYLGFDPPRGADVNDIIVGHACRHVIVHAGATFDKKALAQIRDALPRTLKPDIRPEDGVQFTTVEIRALGEAMKSYITTIARGSETVRKHVSGGEIMD